MRRYFASRLSLTAPIDSANSVSIQPRHFVEQVVYVAPTLPQWPPSSSPAASSPLPPPAASSHALPRPLLPPLLSAGCPPMPRPHRLFPPPLWSPQLTLPRRMEPPPPVPTLEGPTGLGRELHRGVAALVARGTRRSSRRSSARRFSTWLRLEFPPNLLPLLAFLLFLQFYDFLFRFCFSRGWDGASRP